jgi:hypothetical protein
LVFVLCLHCQGISASTPRSTLCYRYCRSLLSRRCLCSKPSQPAITQREPTSDPSAPLPA